MRGVRGRLGGRPARAHPARAGGHPHRRRHRPQGGREGTAGVRGTLPGAVRERRDRHRHRRHRRQHPGRQQGPPGAVRGRPGGHDRPPGRRPRPPRGRRRRLGRLRGTGQRQARVLPVRQAVLPAGRRGGLDPPDGLADPRRRRHPAVPGRDAGGRHRPLPAPGAAAPPGHPRPAHRAAQPGRVLRTAGEALRGPGPGRPVRALLRRPRRLQGGQRQPRPRHRRPAAGRRRGPAEGRAQPARPPGGPARRGRVRRPAGEQPRRAGGRRRREDRAQGAGRTGADR